MSKMLTAPTEKVLAAPPVPAATWGPLLRLKARRYALLLGCLAGDVVLMVLALWAANALWFDFNVPAINAAFYQDFFLYYLGAKVALLFGLGLYDESNHELKTSAAFSLTIFVALAAVLELAAAGSIIFYIDPEGYRLSRGALVLKAALELPLLVVWRLSLVSANHAIGITGHRSVLVGTTREALDVYRGSARQPLRNVQGYVADTPDEAFAEHGAEYLGRPDDIRQILDRVDANEIIICAGGETRNAVLSRINSHSLSIKLFPQSLENVVSTMGVAEINGIPFVELNKPMTSLTTVALKRGMDVTIALIGLLLYLPVLMVLWPVYQIFYGGQLFYRQARVGRDGRIFKIVKIRTMVPDAEKETGPIICVEKDPRVLPIGWVLRKTHLDELPQLWNVLVGDMSFVGPRPERPERAAGFNDKNPSYNLRHIVRPGLTGLAQVKAQYNTYFEHKLFYDLVYSFNFSIWMDLRIIYSTPRYLIGEIFGEKNPNTYC